MSTQLPALALISPVLNGASTLSVDASSLQFVVLADPSVLAVDILVGNTVTSITTFTPVRGANQFSAPVGIPNVSTPTVVQVTGRNYVNLGDTQSPALTPTIQFEIVYLQSALAVMIQAPSGVSIARGQNTCTIQWALPTYLGFDGVRVMWSTDPTGVDTPYTQFGDLITDVSSSSNVPLGPATITNTNAQATDNSTNRVLTTVSTSTIAEVNFSSVTIPQTTVNAQQFFVILTTVVTDPTTGVVYESQAAGPFTCGFVNLRLVAPTDFLALQKTSDIASRLIASITRNYANLDLAGHAEMRDALINPISVVLSYMSVREWYSRCARSVSALSQIDDADADGVSDSFTSSTVKQQIARAFGLSNSDCQTMIDTGFDILGEEAGIERGGATYSTVDVLFYTYTRPTAAITIALNTIVSTLPTASSPTPVSFVTRAQATIDSSNLNAFYDAVNGWWSVTVPCECQQAGSVGNVGAGTLRQITSGLQSNMNATNPNASSPAVDKQSNADYAAMIQAKKVAGRDSSTRSAYWLAARGVPGVVAAEVVAAGDLDMLRDWLTTEQKHVGGCVDVYVEGNTISQQSEQVPFTYESSSSYGVPSSYLNLALIDAINLRFTVTGATDTVYTPVEIRVNSAGRVLYLGCDHATIDANGILTLDPSEIVYQINTDGSSSQWQINGVNATNLQVVQSVGASVAASTYQMMARYQTGMNHAPALQPVASVTSVTGPITGMLDPTQVVLFHTSDFLLDGGSNKAGDAIVISGSASMPVTSTLSIPNGVTVIAIDTNMDVPIDATGAPENILAVRSADQSALYIFGTDYTIVPSGKYRGFALRLLSGTRITDSSVLVTYNRFILAEQINQNTDTLVLNGSTPAALSETGFIRNSWLPASHGITTLLLDGYLGTGVNPSAVSLMGAGVAPASRYIKVVPLSAGSPLPVTPVEGRDFQLTVDSETGAATVARVIGGNIPDGTQVDVTYCYAETFTVVSNYPDYVQQVVGAVSPNDAAAEVLVKAMTASPIDITVQVQLDSATSPVDVDSQIRTILSNTIYKSRTSFAMSAGVSGIQQITGITSVSLPPLKCAKSDGAYDIGMVIPTTTVWTPLGQDPAFINLALPSNAFITAAPVLRNSTIPSGGEVNAYVGLLYEGQSFSRTMTIAEFLTSKMPSFYIVGAADIANTTVALNTTYPGRILLTNGDGSNPSMKAYRCTYQCFGNAGASDIETASCEYLVPGNLQVLYS